jgi:hypothetical protein
VINEEFGKLADESLVMCQELCIEEKKEVKGDREEVMAIEGRMRRKQGDTE